MENVKPKGSNYSKEFFQDLLSMSAVGKGLVKKKLPDR